MKYILPSKKEFEKDIHPDESIHLAAYIKRCNRAELDLEELIDLLGYLVSEYGEVMDAMDTNTINQKLSNFPLYEKAKPDS